MAKVSIWSMTARNGSIDILRFAGAVGIVWFHLKMPGAQFALSALPMFVTLLVYFGAGTSMKKRAARLMAPWAIWCVIYALAKIADALVSGKPVSSEFSYWMLFTGPALHLWFLPFSFFFLALFERLKGRVLWMVAIILSGLSLWALQAGLLRVPLEQWASVVPAAFLGLLMQQGKSPVPVAVGFTAICALLYLTGWNILTMQLGLGALLTLIALVFKSPAAPITTILSNISLGVYLIHPLIYAAALRIGVTDGAIMFLLVLVGSLVATQILRRALPRAV